MKKTNYAFSNCREEYIFRSPLTAMKVLNDWFMWLTCNKMSSKGNLYEIRETLLEINEK